MCKNEKVGRELGVELVLALASPLLVFLASAIGFYFTWRKSNKTEKIDEVKFVVEENRLARLEIKKELELSKIREEQCMKQLATYRDVVVKIREKGRGNYI